MDRRLSLARGGLREEIFNLLRGLNPTKKYENNIRYPRTMERGNVELFRYKWVKKIGINSGCRGTNPAMSYLEKISQSFLENTIGINSFGSDSRGPWTMETQSV